jgi:hypothetical protein
MEVRAQWMRDAAVAISILSRLRWYMEEENERGL